MRDVTMLVRSTVPQNTRDKPLSGAITQRVCAKTCPFKPRPPFARPGYVEKHKTYLATRPYLIR